MKFVLFGLLLLLQYEVINNVGAEAAQTDSCSACNCQVNNVGILKNLVESLVNRSLNYRLPAALNEAVDSLVRDIPGKLQLAAQCHACMQLVNSLLCTAWERL